MYENYFGLKERPFSIAPDPRYLFMSQRHKEALAHLAYGIRQGAGFVLLTGEVGTGKTTICRQILRKLPENTRLAFILNPMLNAEELLATLCDELSIDYNRDKISLKQITDNLTQFLLLCHDQDVNVVLMIDEAQNLAPEVLEQIRLLTNLETDQKKLLQIILVGQPELQELLARKELRQLAQRITARYHLRPLTEEETAIYIQHRLRIAGSLNSIFTRQAIERIYQLSEGVPRLINNLCDRAMMGAFSSEKHTVDVKMVMRAGKEVLQLEDTPQTFGIQWKKYALMTLGVIIVLSAGFWLGQLGREKPIADAEHKTSSNTVLADQKWENRRELFDWILSQGKPDVDGHFARSHLAKRWKLSYVYNEDGDFCRYAIDYKLQCSQSVDSWEVLTGYNRPAVLLIEDGQGRYSWITLHAVNNEQVDIETLYGRRWVKLDWLISVWTRRFEILWQAPTEYQRPFRYGDRGAHVKWLSERMGFLYKDDTISNENVFNEQLETYLMDFQERHGLKADGIAGMNTLIQLNTSTVKDIPRLF